MQNNCSNLYNSHSHRLLSLDVLSRSVVYCMSACLFSENGSVSGVISPRWIILAGSGHLSSSCLLHQYWHIYCTMHLMILINIFFNTTLRHAHIFGNQPRILRWSRQDAPTIYFFPWPTIFINMNTVDTQAVLSQHS